MAYAVPAREMGDRRFTVRQSRWEGGWGRAIYEQAGDPTEPRFWDSFNIDSSIEGELGLAYLWEQVETTATDRQARLVRFGAALYRIDGVAAPTISKSLDGVTFTPVNMTGGPTAAIRSYTVWRDQLMLATGAEDVVYVLKGDDTWTTVEGPVAGRAVEQVAVHPDDELLVWVDDRGLYSWDGDPTPLEWLKIWPEEDLLPQEAHCDLLDHSGGTVVFATRDGRGSSLHEFMVAEGEGLQASVVTWLSEPDLFFYGAAMHDGVLHIGSKRSNGGIAAAGRGIVWRKPRMEAPVPAHEFGDGIRGAVPSMDFGIRAMVSDGRALWVGAPSRARNYFNTVGVPCVYHYTLDAQGIESVSPNSALDGDAPAGLVYGVAVMGGALIMTTSQGTWRRSPTKRATRGYLESSIYDLRSPDAQKIWLYRMWTAEDVTATETIATAFRTGTLTGSWQQSSTERKAYFPHDSEAEGRFRMAARQLQIRTELARGAQAERTPRLTSLVVNAAAVLPLGVER